MTPQLEFVTGKGGVGKSALTAVIARDRAAQGARVLAIAARDPRGLGAHLGADVVDAEPTAVDGVDVALISPGLAMQDYLEKHVGLSTPRIALAANAFEALANTAPGVKEVITIGKAISLAESGRWDHVVVDAPPTGQVASYLGAPGTVLDLVPSGRIHDQAARLADRIRSARLTIVSLLEELPVRESMEALDDLRPLVGATSVVANRVLGPIPDRETVPAGIAREAMALHDAILGEQARWRSVLQPTVELPFVFGSVTPPVLIERLTEARR